MDSLDTVIVYENAAGETLEFSKHSGFFLEDFPLLSGLDITLTTGQSIDQIGGTVESQVISPKSCTIKGFIRGDGTEGKRRLLQVLTPLQAGKFTVNGEYSMEVVVSDTPTVERLRMFPRFDFGVTAAYPFWQKDFSALVPVSGVIGMFRFPWFFRSYQFGYLVSSYYSTVTNSGHIPTYFDLQITAIGVAKNPVFSNVETGAYLKLNKTFAVGERVDIIIRPDRVTATSSLVGDIQGLIDIGSTLFSFDPGDTTLRYDAEEGRSNLTIQLTLTDKFAGVVA